MLRRNGIFCFFLIYLFIFFPIAASSSTHYESAHIPIADGFVSAIDSSPVMIDVQNSATEVTLDFQVSGLEFETIDSKNIWRIENEGIVGRNGRPNLPAISRWIRVPDRGELEITTSLQNQTRFRAEPPALYDDGQDINDNPLRNANLEYPDRGIYPECAVEISEPMVMRGVRVVNLSYYPIRYDYENDEYIRSENLQVTINSNNSPGQNEVENIYRQPSHDFDRMMDALLLNPPQRDVPLDYYKPGGYCVVADTEAPEEVEEFIEWKRRAGHKVIYLQLDFMAMDDEPIRAAIQDEYREHGFEFLVLIGSDHADPPIRYPVNDNFYDIYYAQLEGDDMLPDVAVGTYNCIELPSLICAMRRSISYQSAPYYDDTDWYTDAGVGVGACSVPDDLSPSYTGKWIAHVLRNRGYDSVETSFFADNGVDDPSRMIERLYNNQTNYIIVRAHQWDLEVENIDPGPVYPFQFLVSSGTISPPNNGAFNWIFRIGTPDEMRGPSAGFGHYSSPRTNVANALVGGLTQAIYFLEIDSYGWARNYAVANLARVMVEDGVDLMPYYYSHWRYYGDPSQWCWMGVPRQVTANFPDNIDPRSSDLLVEVLFEDNEQPVANALVCLNQGENFSVVTRTNDQGLAFLNWENNELEPEPLHATVTGENLYPVLDEIEVEQRNDFIIISEYTFEDNDDGNSDGVPSPGEVGRLMVTVSNPSDDPSPEVRNVSITSLSPYVEVAQNQQNIAVLNPGQELVINPVQVSITNDCPDQDLLQLQLKGLIGDNDASLSAGMQFTSAAPLFALNSALPMLDPGADVDLPISLLNNGHLGSSDFTATLESLSPFIEVTNPETHYPPIGVGRNAVSDREPFSIQVHGSAIRGSIAQFALHFDSESLNQTIGFEAKLTDPFAIDPLGPDDYGYIALDDGDIDIEFSNAPDYNWIEINPNEQDRDYDGERVDIILGEEDDVSRLLEMPFPFRYYGEEFDTITVCSNGWLAPGNQVELKNQQNWLLPGINGAFGLIAVYWDRLIYDEEMDGLFYYHDAENSRFIIEWVCGVDEDRDRRDNKFQITIYDSDEHQTLTGDCMMKFQYHTVNNVQDRWEANAHCSVGITSVDGLDGLTYTFWNEYPVQANPLQGGRAILWTTVAYEPSAALTGTVTRWVDEQPVAGALVRTSHDMETVTNENGDFRLFGIPEGEFNVTVSAQHYREIIAEGLEAIPGRVIERDFVLPHVWLEWEPDTLQYNAELFRDVPLMLSATGEGVCNYSINLVHRDQDYEDDIWLEREPIEGQIDTGESREIEILLGLNPDLEEGLYYLDLLTVNDTPRDSIYIPLDLHVTISNIEPPERPYEFSVSGAYPNPFNATASIEITLPAAVDVDVKLYDIKGRLVANLPQDNLAAGKQRVTFNCSELTTGTYIMHLTAGDYRDVQKVVLMK